MGILCKGLKRLLDRLMLTEVFAQRLFAFGSGGYAKFCKTLSDEPFNVDKPFVAELTV